MTTRRTRKSVVVLLLAVPLLAACDNRSADRKAMDTKFEQLVHKYADLLGPKEARQRLTEASDGIAPYCLPCASVLTGEAKRF